MTLQQPVIIGPIITEKSTQDAKNGKFTFKVTKTSGKNQIKKAIEDVFKVMVVSTTTQIIKHRKKRVGKRRIEVYEPAWKKATLRLIKDQKIDLFETGEKK